jgi:hypothetical protein
MPRDDDGAQASGGRLRRVALRDAEASAMTSRPGADVHFTDDQGRRAVRMGAAPSDFLSRRETKRT